MVQNCWYVVMASAAVRGRPVGVVRMGERMVFWRNAEGGVVAMADRCPHKGVALSPGKVVDGRIVCPYHAFAFDSGGACRDMPVQEGVRPALCTKTWPVCERDGFVWLWWGDEAPSEEPPELFPEVRGRPSGTWAQAEIAYPIHYSRMIETNFDFYHAAIAHRSVNIGGLFGAKVADLHVEHDRQTGATDAGGSLVKADGSGAVPFLTRFLPGNLQLISAAGQLGVAATIPVDDTRCISLFRVYSDWPAPFGALQAWLVVQLEKRIVQPQDIAIMDTMTEKTADVGVSRWVEADLGAARYVQWRHRRLRQEAHRAETAVRQAGP